MKRFESLRGCLNNSGITSENYNSFSAYWIKREDIAPEYPKILVYGDGEIFICEMKQEREGHSYVSTDWEHGQGHRRMPDWKWWMPLPEEPK